MSMTLGSLFDGIGGFPLAGMMCGISPVWNSEIEPFPLKVTAARFPEVKQLGSVTDIDGGAVEPVDIITFGSPCQDLSVAGKQLGIHEGQRSNLFFEAVRIIKEMRAADERIGRTGKHIRPRFAVWENVPGAFSSNKGADFKAVLEALAGVREDGVDVPQPKKWNTGGGILGNGWSIAWRVYDAQYWGVPQRRKRIYLVADFASERAPEILFERESVRGNPAESGTAWESIAAHVEGSTGGSCIAFKERAGKPGGGKGILPAVGRAFTLATNVDQSVVYEPKSLMEENWAAQDVKNALRANGSKSGSCVVERIDESGEPICLNFQGNKGGCCTTQDGTVYSLNAMHGHDVHVIADRVKCLNPCDCQSKRQHDINGVYPTLQAYNGGGGRCDGVVYALQGNGIDRADTAGCNGYGWREGEMYTLNTIDRPAVAFQASGDRDNPDISVSDRVYCLAANPMSDRGQAVCVGNGQLHQTDMGDKAGALNCMHDQQAVVTNGNPPRKYIIRRITPTECARLQGFPDDWCEGLGGSDSAIYKAYGNGLALPCAYDVLRRIAKEANSE